MKRGNIMKKKAALFLASVMMLTSNGFAAIHQGDYPLRSNHPNGIEPFSESITSVPMEKRQFDCGYERYSEMFKIEQDSCDGQREIVDNSYSGQFALKISQNSDGYIPICEGVNFYIPEISNTNNENTDNAVTSQDITISTSGTSVSVSGIAGSNTEVCILAKQGGVIKYINQYTADGNGNFEFNFNVLDYGDYNLTISRVNRPLFNYSFSCYPQIVNELSNQGKTKNNRIRLQLKPMENAKNISFYAKAIVDNEGSLQEEYILLTGKKVKNGIFNVGSELSQGKWQELELYTEYDSSVVLNSISDIYVKANTGSKWIVDDVVTDYIGIKETEVDLSDSAIDNVIYQNGLQFARTGQNGKYNTDAKVLTAGTEISGKLNGVAVDSTVQSVPQEHQDDVSETLVGCDFSSNAWTMLQNSQKTESSIIMTTNGIAQLDTGSLSTEDRVVLEVVSTTLERYNSNDNAYLRVEMFEQGDTTPYHTSEERLVEYPTNSVKLILPRIKSNTKFRFTMTTTYAAYNYLYKIELSDFKIRSLSFNDWNFKNNYNSKAIMNTWIPSNISGVSELPNYYENSYAVKNKEYRGMVLGETLQLQRHQSQGKFFVIRVLNLSNTPQIISFISENSSYYKYLPYGESDVYLEYPFSGSYGTIRLYADENVMLFSICAYAAPSTYSDKTFYKGIDGLANDFIISYDGNSVYYTNYNDANAIYKYDIETGIYSKVIDDVTELICLSDDEKQLIYTYNTTRYLYNMETDTKIVLPTGAEYKFNHKGELYIRQNNIIYMYTNGVLFEMLKCPVTANQYDTIQFVFDFTGNYLLVRFYSSRIYDYRLYKKSAGIYTQIESGTHSNNHCNTIYLSDDLSEFFSDTGYGINFRTGTQNGIHALYKASDNTYLIASDGGMALYNPITKEQYKMPIVGGVNHYNPETKIVTSVRNGCFTRYKLSDEKSVEKYMFSFDGKHTWVTYKNGRWITVSKNNKPTNSEMDSMGMYAEEVNNLSRSDFEKLYKDKTDILNLDIAIYMNSNTNELTPVINGITVSTYETDEPYASFAINNSRYNKADYINISSVFPVENLDADSECYYLLYLGNEWIYTYKNGEFIKIDFTSIDIPNDRLPAWAKLKQYAMSARELRNIPSEKLNNLFLNPEYANNEFGVICFIKSEDLEKNSVVIKLQGDKKYTDSGDVVLEIKMNGNDTKIIDSTVFSKEVIDRFLSWVQNRQNGKGDVFFNFNNNETQYFINYFMIDSIGIFNTTSYYSTSAE